MKHSHVVVLSVISTNTTPSKQSFKNLLFANILTVSALKHTQKFSLHHSILSKHRTVPRVKQMSLLGQRRGISGLCAVDAQQNETKPAR